MKPMVLHHCPQIPESEFLEVLGCWQFSATTPSVSEARFVVTTLFNQHDLPQAYEAELIVDELVSNAVVHAQTDFELALERWRDCIRIIVRDMSPNLPQMRTPDPLAENGRGLFMIENVAHEWGHHPYENGKCVWARLVVA